MSNQIVDLENRDTPNQKVVFFHIPCPTCSELDTRYE